MTAYLFFFILAVDKTNFVDALKTRNRHHNILKSKNNQRKKERKKEEYISSMISCLDMFSCLKGHRTLLSNRSYTHHK